MQRGLEQDSDRRKSKGRMKQRSRRRVLLQSVHAGHERVTLVDGGLNLDNGGLERCGRRRVGVHRLERVRAVRDVVLGLERDERLRWLLRREWACLTADRGRMRVLFVERDGRDRGSEDGPRSGGGGAVEVGRRGSLLSDRGRCWSGRQRGGGENGVGRGRRLGGGEIALERRNLGLESLDLRCVLLLHLERLRE